MEGKSAPVRGDRECQNRSFPRVAGTTASWRVDDTHILLRHCVAPYSAVQKSWRFADQLVAVGQTPRRDGAVVRFTGEADEAVEPLSQALTAADLLPSRIEPIEFSLEDLFVIFIEMQETGQRERMEANP